MSEKFKLPAPRVKIIFTPLAFVKMMTLVSGTQNEIGWHGTVERNGNEFRITDILVYPQQVTGVTVTTEQVPYQEWLMKQPNEVFNTLRFQGHSHVNMGCTPSAVDEKCKADIVVSVKEGDYYLFMIWNKKMEFTGELFDGTTWIKYQTKHMEVSIEGVGTIDEYLASVNKLVTARTYQNSNYYGNYNYGGASKSNSSTPKTGVTSAQSQNTSASNKLAVSPAKNMDDEDDEWLEWIRGRKEADKAKERAKK